ncbi:S-layer protein domain-containing protein [Methanococcoides alaskense]|uniref:S-layer protein (TIGR01567 family) n=1 Tax=Methanococcoides alaskense TaxID=325778 RepID=A0AA90TYV4_9EURY|nr:S-layer protein domain-containing protein [Methanococcoides alaskense]MDA0524072.1 S-layer protein domain-containing protein [Methanococcoides alaskense]MDR6222522.1 S-layer protein (TIGR01567 family) [Methanococcoides alaskense]
MNKHFKFILISLLILGMGCGVAMAAPTIDGATPPSPHASEVGVQVDFFINITETSNVTWYVDGISMATVIGVTDSTYSNSTASVGPHTVVANATSATGSTEEPWAWTVTAIPAPLITSNDPSLTFSNNVGDSQTFTIDIDQTVDVNWLLDGNLVSSNSSVITSSYTNNSAESGIYNLTAFVTNANGTDQAIWDWTVDTAAPEITSNDPSLTFSNNVGDSQIFTIDIDQTVDVNWLLDGNLVSSNSSVTTSSYTNNSAEIGTYNLTAFVTNANGTDQAIWDWTVSAIPGPQITSFDPSDLSFESIEGTLQEFSIEIDQVCDVTWYVDGGSPVTESSVTSSFYNITNPSTGTYNVSVNVSNVNGVDSEEWAWTVHPVTYYSGDRIWDVNAGQSLDYTWDALSYSGFFYDLESGLGSETMTIHLDSDSDRNIGDGDLEYETTPVETDFEYDDWGSYEVIGFMAEKYFAGYTSDSDISDESISLMSKGHLAKVLIDTDDKQSVYGGAGLVLEEGYVLNIVELDVNGDRVFVSLSKDGDEVDELVVSSGNPYVYEKDLGDVDDVPIIAVNFAEIFSGTETSAVFIEGIFQISDEYEDINRGDEYGSMEVKTISSEKIRMENEDTIDLDKGDIADIMGKLKFIVADDNDLRFAPFVDMSEPGTYELRGTIAENEGLTWTPLNFEGFYYNIDEGIGTEKLNLTYTGRTIGDDKLVYSTSPSNVSFEHSDWGSYNVIGFMAEKFFAGYPDNEFTNDVSMISKGQLSKVLIDDDDKRSIFGGSSIILEEGYSLDIVEVDMNGERVFVSLSKDGDEVDELVVSSGKTYVYEKDLGDVDDVPIIAVYFKEIFSGQESTAVFVEGIFQISDEYDEINTGDNYGEMEVKSISSTKIEMRNDDSISLSEGEEIEIMGEIKFKVADTNDDVRYYPFVEISTAPADSLDVEVEPEIVSEGDKITVIVTSRGSLVNGVTVKSGNIVLGTTDDEGEVDYTFHADGDYTITAEKDGYTNGEASLEVISPDDESRKMSIEFLPEVIYEGNLVTFTVVKSIGGDALEDVNVTIDGKSIGGTDGDGVVTDVLREIGMHKITAEKEGFLKAEENLEVKELEAKFEFSNLLVTPLEVKTGKDVKVNLDAVNNGKAAGSYTVELLVNDNTTTTQEISLGVGESTPVEFEYTAGEPGTYLVKVGGMTATVEVVKGTSTVTYLIGGVAIAVLGGAAYLFTAGGWTVSTAGAKAGEAAAVLSEKLSSLLSRGK